MRTHADDSHHDGHRLEVIILATRHSISERLLDPYLTDHDRWVLRQFGKFLSGIAPDPDPRVLGQAPGEHRLRVDVHARYR